MNGTAARPRARLSAVPTRPLRGLAACTQLFTAAEVEQIMSRLDERAFQLHDEREAARAEVQRLRAELDALRGQGTPTTAA